MSLPKSVITEDHKLEKASSSAAEALMRLRWHWTVDESNPKRVAIREYARAVGVNESTIRRDSNGYPLIAAGTGRTPTEARERALMGVETAAATEAVAQARGVSTQQARKARPTETRRVREIARQRAEDKGTSVEEEAPQIARAIVRAEKAEQTQRAERQQRLGLRFVEMEGKLVKASKLLREAVDLGHTVPWGDEERELLANTLANIKTLVRLIDMAFGEDTDIDWDAELRALTND